MFIFCVEVLQAKLVILVLVIVLGDGKFQQTDGKANGSRLTC